MKSLKTDKKLFWLKFPILVFLWLLVKLGNLGINLFLSIINPAKNLYKSAPKKENIPIVKVKKGRKIRHWRIFRVFQIFFSKKVRLVFVSVFLAVAFVAYSYFLVEIAHDLPSPNKLRELPTPTTTEFYDRRGNLLYRFYEGKNRTPVKLAQIPRSLIYATIALEDKNFYSHFGVDFYGIARALI